MNKRKKGKGIPDEVIYDVEKIIDNFNEQMVDSEECYYVPRYKGKYLYLDRMEYGKLGPICRLKYNGKMDDWDFEIYKFSSDQYDPEEWFFPGVDEVDGTIEGAMKAGLEAYPY